MTTKKAPIKHCWRQSPGHWWWKTCIVYIKKFTIGSSKFLQATVMLFIFWPHMIAMLIQFLARDAFAAVGTWVQDSTGHNQISQCVNLDDTGWVFSLVPPRKVLSIELVPPNREKWLSSPKVAKNPTRKVEVQVRVYQTFTFYCNLAGIFLCVTGSDLDFHFFRRDFCYLR